VPPTEARRAPIRPPLKRPLKRSWWQGPWPIIIAGGLVLAMVAALVYLSLLRSPGPSSAGITGDQIAARVAAVSPAVSSQIGAGGTTNPFSTGSSTALRNSAGLPMVIYVGADYCPYCAAERWSLVLATSRFGQLRNMSLGSSSSTDVFPNTPTFSFTGATYTSSVIDFSFVETSDRQQKPKSTPDVLQQSEFTKYNSTGSIPFVDIASRHIAVGSGYPPDVLQNLSWSTIASDLINPDSLVAKDIVGNANWITAAICQVTGSKPQSTCAAPEITTLESQLGK